MSKTWWIFIFVFTLIVACGPVPESRYYLIDYPLPAGQGLQDGKPGLYIQRFDADPIYKQDRFVYKPSAYEVKFDNYRRWATTPSEMLTLKALEHFRASGLFGLVTLIPPARSGYLFLTGRLTRFEEVYEGSRHLADVAAWFEVKDSATHKVLWSGLLQRQVEITEATPVAIVRAMSEATSQIFDDLAEKIKPLL